MNLDDFRGQEVTCRAGSGNRDPGNHRFEALRTELFLHAVIQQPHEQPHAVVVL